MRTAAEQARPEAIGGSHQPTGSQSAQPDKPKHTAGTQSPNANWLLLKLLNSFSSLVTSTFFASCGLLKISVKNVWGNGS